MRLSDLTFRQRHHAALTVVHRGELEGDLALSYVLWPSTSDLPRDPTIFGRIAIDRRKCKARLADGRCTAKAEVGFALCEEHLWAFMAGQDFDFWVEEAA